MPATHAPYTNANLEFWEIHDLLTEGHAALGRFHGWSFCRFENWRYRLHPHRLAEDPAYLAKLAEVWRDGSGRVVAVAISESGGDDIHVLARLGCRWIEPEVYGWIGETWAAGHPRIETMVEFDDAERKALLASLGYRYDGDDGYTRRYDLDRVRLDDALPEGWAVQDILADRDRAGRAAAIGAGFHADFVLSDRYLARWESARGAPGYRPELELSVVNREGVHGAGCIGWVDLRNRVGEVEPVATHPAYRRRGLATAMIRECFRRMRELGLRAAFIGSGPEPNPSNRLYESLGPADKRVDERWVRELADGPHAAAKSLDAAMAAP